MSGNSAAWDGIWSETYADPHDPPNSLLLDHVAAGVEALESRTLNDEDCQEVQALIERLKEIA